MARRRRRTIAYNPLDDLASSSPAVELNENPRRPRRRESAVAAAPGPDEANMEAGSAASKWGSCWMWWAGAGLVAVILLA